MKNLKKVFIVLLSIILLVSFNVSSLADELDETYEEMDYVWLQEKPNNNANNLVEELKLDSRYIVAMDRDSKAILFSKNENKRVPMASTTKIMTAIVLCEYVEQNESLSFDTEIEVCKQAALIGGSRLGLKTGDKITINNLLYGLMLCSRK